jgi:glycosyltransferase involved in cell wall biosynthesis
MSDVKISVIIPVFNEEENVSLLHESLAASLSALGAGYEIIFIDDGSTDNSLSELKKLKAEDENVKLIEFTKNFGQTSAWDAGIKLARGEYLITMDADLQNDPSDIPKLLKKIEEGYDVVSGWRVDRKDTFFKRIFSSFANTLRRFLIKEEIHDSGCSLKIYKRECFDGLNLYGEMHRYITAILAIRGFNTGEIKVKHSPRRHGKTKYGTKRLFKGFLDLFTVYFLNRYLSRPIHLFGGLGLFTFLAGFIIGGYLTIAKIFYGISLSNRPLLILSVLLIILGIQFLIFGIIAEILMRIYYRVHNTTPYAVKEILE